MASHLRSHQKSFWDSLQKMKENDVITDITLILPDESSIPCHKLILMTSSPFFERMFQSGLKECTEKDVKLDFADADIIRILVDFFYSGEIQVTEDNVKALVEASEFLCCEHLKVHCDEYLAAKVTSSNYLDLYKFSKMFNLGMLLASAFAFMLGHFKEFMETSDFDHLTEDELLKVVSDDGLNAENEDMVFEAVLQWLNVDLDLRKEVFPRVAPLIRFPFCSTASLTHNISNNQLVLDSGRIALVHEALKSQHHCNSHSTVHNARFVPRRAFTGKKQRLIRMVQINDTVSIEYTDRTGGSVIATTGLEPGEKSALNRYFVSPSRIYWFDYTSSENFNFFDAESMEITSFPCGRPRYCCALAFFDGKIFAFGGISLRCGLGNENASKSVKSFNMKEVNPEWKSEPEMLKAVFYHCVVPFDNNFFAFGGCAGDGFSMMTQEFDIVMGKWRRRSDMPGSCAGGTPVALNDKIYVVGGDERVCYSYDPGNDKWKILSKPTGYSESDGSFNRMTTTWHGKILHTCNTDRQVEQYDPENDTWSVQNQWIHDSDFLLHTLFF